MRPPDPFLIHIGGFDLRWFSLLIAAAVLAGALLAAREARRREGDLFLGYLIAYPTVRLLTELQRPDAWRILGLPTAQWISLALLAVGLGALALRRRLPAPRPARAPEAGMGFEVIIAGGSFAALGAALALGGRRVLVVHREPLGAHQTSACGTLLEVLRATRTQDSLLQVHPEIAIHLPGADVVWRLGRPFCTFDYGSFCRILAARARRAGVEFLQATVLEAHPPRVVTTAGELEARFLVDATGWPARLARTERPPGARPEGVSFGLETEVDRSARGLHFWYQPRLLPQGVTWLFPCRRYSRVGVASYLGGSRLGQTLDEFLEDLGAAGSTRHGGYFPHVPRPAVSGPIFRVGDAAGQCIALTGEGIRPALYFGQAAGRSIREALRGRRSAEEALRAYQALVARHLPFYRFMLMAQRLMLRLPVPAVTLAAKTVSRPPILHRFEERYVSAFRLEPGPTWLEPASAD